jgi:hypothetical protein
MTNSTDTTTRDRYLAVMAAYDPLAELEALIDDETIPIEEVAKIIRSMGGRVAIDTIDDDPKSLDDSGSLWVTSDHSLVVHGYTVATWSRVSRGAYAVSGYWSIVEDTDGGDILPERIESLLSELELEDEIPSILEPDETEGIAEDPEGEWCVYWASACREDESPRGRYASSEDAGKIAEVSNRDLCTSTRGVLLCGYEVRQLVDGEWVRVDD